VVSSSGEMYCCAGLVSGVYVSGRMSSSKNISLLKSMNLSMLTSMGLVSVYLIIFQNCLGLYFRMSGLELEFGSLSSTAFLETCVVFFCACVFFTVSSFGLFVLGSRLPA
jgi:hypothetical protein